MWNLRLLTLSSIHGTELNKLLQNFIYCETFQWWEEKMVLMLHPEMKVLLGQSCLYYKVAT